MPPRTANQPSLIPPPSSRAAGKQPMAYAPNPSGGTGTGQTPPTSARAAAKAPASGHGYHGHNHGHGHGHPSPPPASAPNKPRPPSSANPGNGAPTATNAPATKANPQKIWSTSSSEERERIKEFWLGLGEDERRNLVKVEKDTVLRKMKEQQKHSCACAVCGRKRNAIEEELEVLYEAYYEELEQHANYEQRYASSGGTLPPPPGPGPFPGSVELDKNGAVVGHHPLRPPAKTKPPAAVDEDEFDDEDDYEEEEDDEIDEEDDEDDEEEDLEDEHDIDSGKTPLHRRTGPPGKTVTANARRRPINNMNGVVPKPPARSNALFNLGNGLTAAGPGNILTVADDLLKNDGQKFLEMMETLAERRMAREEEAAGDVEDDSAEEDDDEEDDEEDDDDEDISEDDGSEEEEPLTEEQKMEEGKRMFSIFAARMFEQRVLQAYRERVAQERQAQLLRELEDEDKLEREREAKKQTQNQKKKDKKKLQKQTKDEERALKAAAKAAEEQANKAKQLAAEEEARKKREEDRLRRKALDEEKARKEEEKRREEREREAERERKRKEARREKDEREKKEREAREKREREERAKKDEHLRLEKEKQERERLAKERREKEEREAKEKLAAQRAQQVAAAAAKSQARTPASPRNAAASGSAQRANTPKKILKPPPPTAPVQQTSFQQMQQVPRSNPPPRSQPPVVPAVVTSTPTPQQASPAFTNVTQPVSPRLAHFPHQIPQPSYGNFSAAGPVTPSNLAQSPLASSVLPRNYLYDPPGSQNGTGLGFSRAQGINAMPIGHAVKSSQPINPVAGVISAASMLGHPKRSASGSAIGMMGIDPGPIGRPLALPSVGPIAPIAPIGRPGIVKDMNGSPSQRRSPSPKGVLGSAALIADDDEMLVPPPTSRRLAPLSTAVGSPWSPRSAFGQPSSTPWGPPENASGFAAPRGSVGNGLWGLPVGMTSPNNQAETWGNPTHSPFGGFVPHSLVGEPAPPATAPTHSTSQS